MRPPVGLPRKIPDEVVKRIKHARQEGKTHQEILLQFTDLEERLAAGAALSMLPTDQALQAFRARNRVLMVLLILFASMWIMWIPYEIAGIIWGAGLIWLAILVKRRSPWGYSGAMLYAILDSLNQFFYVSSDNVENVDAVDAFLTQLLLVIVGMSTLPRSLDTPSAWKSHVYRRPGSVSASSFVKTA